MSSQALRLILTRALTDKDFCELLLKKPEEAIKTYPLRRVERDVILSTKFTTLRDLVVWLCYKGLAGYYEDFN